MKRFPEWMKKPVPSSPGVAFTREVLEAAGLNTVCRSAHCPNQAECFAAKTATFMILGTNCTRNCTFCAVEHGQPQGVDSSEPEKIVVAIAKLGLQHVVITSVTRDDLPDGGAAHFAAVVKSIKAELPQVSIEILTPDFQGQQQALEVVGTAAPHIFNHNLETVARLYPYVRPQAIYERSLAVLAEVKKIAPEIITKSGLMVGLGESPSEMEQTIKDIYATGATILTIGQYLQPSKEHYPLKEFVKPEQFAAYESFALDLGFKHVASGPFVRSSFKAAEAKGLINKQA